MAFCLLFFFSCAKEVSKQEDTVNMNLTPLAGDSCNEGTNCSLFTSQTYNVDNVPGYPGCVFRITVQLCIEEIFGTRHITVGDYSMGFGHGCTLFYDELNALLDTPSELDENEFVLGFDNKIFTRLEDFIWAQHGQNIACSSANSTANLTISFVRQACSTICFYQYELVVAPKGGANGENTGSRLPKPTNFVKASCSTSGCCRRQTNMCFNPSTGLVVKTTSNTVFPLLVTPVNACAGGTLLVPPTPNGTRLIRCNACTFVCPN